MPPFALIRLPYTARFTRKRRHFELFLVQKRNSHACSRPNCVIYGNIACTSNPNGGGAVACSYSSSATITNCTITANTAPGTNAAGGVYCYRSTATITNCILWGDSGGSAPEIVLLSSSALTVSHSDVHGGEAEAYVESDSTLIWGAGNIDADPEFAFDEDYHLLPDSPCIDGGTNDPPGGLPPDDFDGSLRPIDGDGDQVPITDMGAYEFNPSAPSIALSATTLNFATPADGPNPEAQVIEIRNCGGGTLNWEIQEDCPWLEIDPLTGSSTGEIDLVALSIDKDGLLGGDYMYVVTVSDPEAVNSPRLICVMLHVGVTLYVPDEYGRIQEAIGDAVDGDVVLLADGTYMGWGNKELDFRGKAITVRSESGPQNCTIDCQHSGQAFYFHSGEGPGAVVDGLTITNGHAQDDGGIYCYESSPTIVNCIISNNTADSDGGGIYCYESSPTIVNCTISNNTADSNGGGIYCDAYSSPIITNCVIDGNISEYGTGGGICCFESSPTIANCTISNNTAGSGGGGIGCFASSPTIANCTIANNTADGGGGIWCHAGSSAIITNCVIDGNISKYVWYGGGGICLSHSSPTVANW